LRKRCILAAVLAAALLFGCASPEELRQRDEATCTGYGFVAGTPDFATCLQREDIARRVGAGPALSFGVGFSRGF